MAPPPPFGRMASPPPNSTTPNGWRRRRPTASRIPVDSVAAVQQPRDSQRTVLHCPAALQPQRMSSTLSGRSSIPQRTPASLSLAVPVAPASALPAPCVSLLPRRTAPCQLRVKRRGVFPSASGHGNKSPSRIPREASDRKKDTSRQYIAAMYSNKANHGKN